MALRQKKQIQQGDGSGPSADQLLFAKAASDIIFFAWWLSVITQELDFKSVATGSGHQILAFGLVHLCMFQ